MSSSASTIYWFQSPSVCVCVCVCVTGLDDLRLWNFVTQIKCLGVNSWYLVLARMLHPHNMIGLHRRELSVNSISSKSSCRAASLLPILPLQLSNYAQHSNEGVVIPPTGGRVSAHEQCHSKLSTAT